MMNIVSIPTSKIYSHPNNPRTDLGDISELTASIKTMGILQNLTVVPYDPTVHLGVNVTGDGSDCYIAVAGNRRLAAAKAAKLAEVPAVISDMDFKAQLKVMLVENLQRETLSVYQQSKAIQTMLDLGETVSDIAKETGFSETTVRKRASLAVFDPSAMSEVEGRNASLKDYLDLAKLEDETLRNDVLKSIGTDNFRNELARARSTLRDRKNREKQLAVVSSFATKKESAETTNLKFVRSYYSSDSADNIVVPQDKDTVQYYYTESSYLVQLYRDKTAQDTAEQMAQDKLTAEANNRNNAINMASNRAYELRVEFVKNLTPAKVKKGFAAVVAAIGSQMLSLNSNGYSLIRLNHTLLSEMTGIPLNDKKEVTAEALEKQFKASQCPEWDLFAVTYAMLDTGDNGQNYISKMWEDGCYVPKFNKNEALDRAYSMLVALGYGMSDEEKQLQNGTHPMFYVTPVAKTA